MHENLLQLANKMDGSRKTLKQTGLAAESKVQDAEKLAEKAKAKYDQLAEDLDRVKTGDTGAGRKFGLKGPKSAAQHEEDLQRKLQAADQDYASKVQTAQAYRKELLASTRPQAISGLLDLIKETDAALTMEMQKYGMLLLVLVPRCKTLTFVASFNEKLVVNNGQVVSPQPLKGSTAQPPPSVNQLIYQINNDKDFDDYILKNASKVSAVKPELQYVKHPTQAPAQSYPSLAPTANNDRRTSMPPQVQPPASFSTHQPEANGSSFFQQPPPQQLESESQAGFSSYQASSQPPQAQASTYGKSPYSPVAANAFPQAEYPRGPAGQATAQQTSGVLYNNPQPPVHPVFGITLEDLFHRDGSPVPMVVYQCIQAVDLFGLEVEGIYRIPGTSSHIQQMKALFDSGKLIRIRSH